MISPFSHIDGGEYLKLLILLGGLFIFAFIAYLSPMEWTRRRVRWLTDLRNPHISKYKEDEDTIYSFFDEKRITYEYHRKERKFHINTPMIVNPFRSEEEWEKRRHKIQARMKQTDIPHDGEVTVCVNCAYFYTNISLEKKDATKDNVCRIHDILMELKKDDYDQPIYTRETHNEDILYTEADDDGVRRLLLIHGDETERYEVNNDTEIPDRLSETYAILNDENTCEELKLENFITQEEFEKLWEDSTPS